MQQQELVAGDSLNFLTAGGAYPASSGWVLKYRLVPRTTGNAVQELTATAEGSDHRVAVAASSTSNWAADSYTWVSWVERAGEVYTLEHGQLTVKANPRTVGAGYDGRSQARKALEDLNAALAGWSPLKRRYKIGEREMEFNSPAEILKLISFWEGRVAEEDAAERLSKGLKPKNRILTRFVRPR